jgi:hypothetical protein
MTNPSATTPSAVLYLATWLPEQLHDQFSPWCDNHHREQLALPGFRRARRFEWESGRREDDPPQYLTMYDLDSLESLTSDAYLEHTRSSPGLPDFLLGNLRIERRNCLVVASLPALWWPPSPTPLLDLFQLTNEASAAELRDGIKHLASPATSGFTLRVIDSDDNDPLVLVDHGDDATEMIDTLTGGSGSLRSTWRCCFDEFA